MHIACEITAVAQAMHINCMTVYELLLCSLHLYLYFHNVLTQLLSKALTFSLMASAGEWLLQFEVLCAKANGSCNKSCIETTLTLTVVFKHNSTRTHDEDLDFIHL